MKPRQFIAIVLIIAGLALVLVSPWLVLKYHPVHSRLFIEGWGHLKNGQSYWISRPRQPALFGWFSGFIAAGVGAMFGGLWLFRSARIKKITFTF